LWDTGIDRELKPHSRPEILDADLAWLVQELAYWGVADFGDLRWLDRPPAGHYAQAVDLLTLMGGLDGQSRITARGKWMAALPAHPRLARMLTAAEEHGGIQKACDLAALITERDIFRAHDGTLPADIEARLQVLAEYRNKERQATPHPYVDATACAAVDRAARQFRRLLNRRKGAKKAPTAGALLAYAYPDRIAQLRPAAHDRYLLANGRGVCLPVGDHLVNTPYLVAAHLDAGQAEGRIYLAASISATELFAVCKDSIQRVKQIYWDSKHEQVVMARQERLQQMVLTSSPLAEVEPAAVQQAMLEGIRQMGPEVLPWTREARTLQARILLLRELLPELSWPDCRDQAFLKNPADWLGPYLTGITRRQHLANLNMTAILKNRLDWKLLQQLDKQAPAHIRVPSGSKKRVLYAPDTPPVLAVRLQEMFGLQDTPSLCGGRVKVMLHLLSPALRPIQITQDLQGFWNNTYPEVKKELQGRYPKHNWPVDPWSAVPTARAKARRKK
jgi:ATP-dependent helicase HrpB